MRTGRAILLCSEPQSSKWQVSRPSGAKLLLIGWKDSAPCVDGGVPPWAAQVLATTLTATYEVTFPSTVVRTTDVESSRPLRANGFWRRLTSTGPSNFSLITTGRAAAVIMAFEDPGFPWCMQAQVLLLHPRGSSYTPIGCDELLASLESPADAQGLDSGSSVAQLRPGVDGDVAGLITFRENEEQAFFSSLQQTAAALGVLVETMTEDAFSERLAR